MGRLLSIFDKTLSTGHTYSQSILSKWPVRLSRKFLEMIDDMTS